MTYQEFRDEQEMHMCNPDEQGVYNPDEQVMFTLDEQEMCNPDEQEMYNLDVIWWGIISLIDLMEKWLSRSS